MFNLSDCCLNIAQPHYLICMALILLTRRMGGPPPPEPTVFTELLLSLNVSGKYKIIMTKHCYNNMNGSFSNVAFYIQKLGSSARYITLKEFFYYEWWHMTWRVHGWNGTLAIGYVSYYTLLTFYKVLSPFTEDVWLTVGCKCRCDCTCTRCHISTCRHTEHPNIGHTSTLQHIGRLWRWCHLVTQLVEVIQTSIVLTDTW